MPNSFNVIGEDTRPMEVPNDIGLAEGDIFTIEADKTDPNVELVQDPETGEPIKFRAVLAKTAE